MRIKMGDDTGETDPLDADSDDDGIPDGQDPLPLSPIRPDADMTPYLRLTAALSH